MMKHYARQIFLICIYFCTLGLHPSQATGEEENDVLIRPPAVAGMFYPDSPEELRREITLFLDQAPEVKPAGIVLAALAPHAGYAYSGGVAACTYKLLPSVEFDTLVIIGHDTFRDAVAFLCPVDYFRTPLGKMPVDREMVEKMRAFHPGIKSDRMIHVRDHTVEVHLPFLQVQDRQCRIVPILFGNPTIENCRILSEAILAATGNKKVFVLASTDLSHYPPYDAACRIDKSTLAAISAMDIDKFFNYISKYERQSAIPNLRTAICASGGVGTAMLCAKARGADHAQILHYANSGDIPAGDKRRVVGYGSALFVKKSKKPFSE